MDRTGPQGLALLLAASASWRGGSRHLSEPEEPRLEDRKVLFPPKVAGRLTTNPAEPEPHARRGPRAFALTQRQSFSKHARLPHALPPLPGALPINEGTN